MSEPVTYEMKLVALPWLTSNQRGSWRTSYKLIADWRAYAGWRARAQGIPAMPAAHVVIELRFTDERRRDPANWAPTGKAIVDGLVDAGVFVDDDHSRVVGPDMRIGPRVRGAKFGAAVVYLTPLAREMAT